MAHEYVGMKKVFLREDFSMGIQRILLGASSMGILIPTLSYVMAAAYSILAFANFVPLKKS